MLKATPSVIVMRTSRVLDALPSAETNTTNGSSDVFTPPYWSLTDRTIFATVLSLMMAVAIIGNSLVITVIIKNRGMRTRTNMFLCNLAVADLLCALLDMPLSLVTIIYGDWVFNDSTCQFNGFALPFLFVASIHTLMYIGIHKYLSIRYPLRQVLTQHRVRLMIGAAWLWATLTGYLTIHGLNTVTYKPETTQCGPIYPSNPWTYSHLIFMIITCYLVPLVILAVCYIGMFREIKALSARMEQNTTMEKELIYMQQRRITLTLFIVLIFFVVCWTPYIFYSVSVSVIKDKHGISKYANPFSYWCGYLSSALNPLIYGLMSPAFREGYKELMCQVGGEEIVSDGYSYYRRKRRPWSTISVSSNYYDKGAHGTVFQPFGQFRSFLQQHLGIMAQDSDSSFGSAPVSRKTSFTSIANFVLFPKSRTMSTNSLPRNFAYSASLPGRFKHQREQSQMTLLNRLSKMLSTESSKSDECVKTMDSSAVYYPPSIPRGRPKPDIEIHIETVEEESSVTPDLNGHLAGEEEPFGIEIAPLLNVPPPGSHSPSPQPTTLTVNADIAIRRASARTSSASSTSHGHRHSIESGFNEEVFPVPEALVPGVRRTSQPVTSTTRKDSLFGDTLTVPDETRHWFSKSLSEEGKKSANNDDLNIDKSTSDTCILKKKDAAGGSGGDLGKEPEKPSKMNLFKRLFSKSSSSSEGERRQRQAFTGESVSSVEDSPGTERRVSTGLFKKYFRSVSADPTRTAEESTKVRDSRHLSFDSSSLPPQRSASTPSLLERKPSTWARIKNKYSIRRRNKRKGSSGDTMKKGSSEGLVFGRLIRSRSERSPTKLQKFPSIEKLDTMNQESLYKSYSSGLGGRKQANYVSKKKLMDRRCVSHEVVHGTQTKVDPVVTATALDTEVVLDDFPMHQDANPQKVNVYLYRSASDPNMTFQMIEDRVLQRVATRKWDRKRRSCKMKNAKSKSCHVDINGDAGALPEVCGTETTECDTNQNNNSNRSNIPYVCIMDGDEVIDNGDIPSPCPLSPVILFPSPVSTHTTSTALSGLSVSDPDTLIMVHPETPSPPAQHPVNDAVDIKHEWTGNGVLSEGEGCGYESHL